MLYQYKGQGPAIIVTTVAELPTKAAIGVGEGFGGDTKGLEDSAKPGTVAYVASVRMELIFDGTAWLPYADTLYLLEGDTLPINPPDGAKLEMIDSGTKYIALRGTWHERG